MLPMGLCKGNDLISKGGNLLFVLLQHRKEISAALQYALDSDRVFADAKENNVVADASQACIRTNFRP